MPLGIFGFMALWSPFFIVALVFLTAVYFLLTVKWRRSFPDSEPLKKKQAVYFILGMLLLYVVKGSPVEVLSSILFSAHMTQMALLYLVVTPLIILGIPTWVWKAVIKLPVIKGVFGFMTKPLISLLSFNVIFSIYHIPIVFDHVRTDPTSHGLAMTILFILSLFMWWPLLNPGDEDIDLSGLKRIGYILGSAVLLTPACGLIIFAENPLYAPYYDPQEFMKALALCVPANTLDGLSISGPELFTNMSIENDQQLGGVIMKIIQEIVFGVMLFNLFFQWYRSDQEKQEKLSLIHLQPNRKKQYLH